MFQIQAVLPTLYQIKSTVHLFHKLKEYTMSSNVFPPK